MSLSSDVLEQFHERLRAADADLTKLRGAEVTKTDLITSLRSFAKDWLRYSETLRAIETVQRATLDTFDAAMRDVLQATNVRTRSSSYKKKLAPVVAGFVDAIIIPVIRHEGSPAQVAARQLVAAFESHLTSEEVSYVEEAARCLAAKCHRAALIMLWAAGVARLHHAVEKIGFNAFNAALDGTLQKKGTPFSRVSKTQIGSLPELQRARDFDLLVVGMSLWGYDLQVYEELDRLLGIRNSAAHPGMVQPSALDVQQFASKLATYLFAKVPA